MRRHVREHFGQMLHDFRERSAATGPASGAGLDALRAAQGLVEGAADDWATLTHPEGADGLLRAFCAARGIAPDLDSRQRALLLSELQKGQREYVEKALTLTAEFETLPLEEPPRPEVSQPVKAVSSVSPQTDALPFAEVLSRYFTEIERTKALAAKTAGEKQDALALMSDLTGGKAPAHMTKADAQEIKAALFKLPKNRSKNSKTRALPLRDALEVPGVERIAARTMNVYLGHMQHFFGWAVDNGYATDNIFQGLRLKRTARTEEDGRTAFSADQLKLMFTHLTDPHSPLVKKAVHKWPALIGMFTGMRLNEVAQLEVNDIELRDEVWCINVTPDGEDNKRLKNASSKRRVPVHSSLIPVIFDAKISLTYPPQVSHKDGANRNSLTLRLQPFQWFTGMAGVPGSPTIF
jgi:integrase